MHNIYFVSYLAGSALLVYEPRYELGIFSSDTIPLWMEQHRDYKRIEWASRKKCRISRGTN